MNMKRIISTALSLALLATFLTVPAMAADSILTLREDWRLTSDLDLNVPEGTTLTIDALDGRDYHIYEMGGTLQNSGLGTVIFADGTMLYPAADDADAEEIVLDGIWDSGESAELMTLRQPHTVTISGEINNGTIEINKAAAKKNDTVTLTITPAIGYELDAMTVTDANGGMVTVTNNQFTMPACAVTVTATFKGHVHSYAEAWSSDANGHWHACASDSCDAPQKDYAPHSGGIATTTEKAACSVCGAKYGDLRPGSGNSSGGSASSTTTTTEKNPDGSTTTTTTNKRTGETTETTKTADGVTSTVVTDKNGEVTSVTAKIPASATKNAAIVTLPLDVPAADNSEDAPAVEIDVPSGGAVVEIPVEEVSSGLVAVLVSEDGTEKIVRSSTVGKDGVVVVLDADAMVKVVDYSVDFVDVVPNSTFEDAIDFMSARGLMNGVGDGSNFGGNGTATRAMVWTILGRGMDEDLYGAGVFGRAGAWAMENGISDGSNPNGNITRQQFAVMLWRMAGEPLSSHGISEFNDHHHVSGYADAAMRWAVEHGILSGNNGNLNPGGNATRNHIAAMYMRYANMMNQ